MRPTNTDLRLGESPTDDLPRFDAAHIAVFQAVLSGDADYYSASDPVGLVEGTTDQVTSKTKSPVGVIDPFLDDDPKPGDRVWVFVYPNTITSQHHRWTSKHFPEAGA